MKAKVIKKVLSTILFVVSLAPVLSSAEELKPIPQSEWCATPPDKSAQVEASAECIECLAGQSVGVSSAVAEVASFGKKLQEETERERAEREAMTYFVLFRERDEDAELRPIWKLVSDIRYFKESSTPEDVEMLKALLKDEEDYKNLISAKNDEIKSAWAQFRSKNQEKKFTAMKAMSLEELKKFNARKRKEVAQNKNFDLFNEQFSGSPPCRLEDIELMAILAYTGNLFATLNSDLRTKNSDSWEYKLYLPYIGTMERALAKLKEHQQVVYRKAKLSPQIVEQYKVGETIVDPAYISTSRSKSYTNPTNADRDRVVFEILSKSGKYVAPFSIYSNEEEVLFQPNRKFRVKEKVLKAKDNWLIKLEEIVD